ncbi:hypothetical protein [Sphingomonas crocodyli]|uniref:Uncharacterized protein n=1 Tax=Sphingomonas crocodyli TaxID=1979270 RepID=A0A437LXZ9_9SPHN|nr:hypothetical protein [Sphingomonas crocodyli]RVT90206.1 hypothetical protein EOD43_18080 [Sphingomonas crocodyli]
MIEKIYEQAPKVSSVAGAVEVACPDGNRVIFTAEAAIETSMELLDKAAEACGKRLLEHDVRDRLLMTAGRAHR